MRTGVFLFFLALFAVTTAGHIYTIDGYLNYSVTKSMASRGALDIPKFMMTVEGRNRLHYSKLGIGQSVVGLPFYGLGSLVERIAPGSPVFRAYSQSFEIPHGGELITSRPQTLVRAGDRDGARVFFTTLTNAVVGAALCLIFWMLLRAFGLRAAAAFGGTLVLAFGTPLWVYSRDLFAEPLFACCLVATFYLLKDPAADERWRLALAGLASSLGMLARVSFVPIAAIFAGYLVLASGERGAGVRKAWVYGLYCLPGIILVGLANLARFGSPILTGYHTAFDRGFSTPLWQGLIWNLVSPYRSVVLYAPPVLLLLVGVARFARKYRAQFIVIASITVYVFVVYSRWWAWHGGWCWGPRFLFPVIPLLMLPGVLALGERRKWALPLGIVLGLAGFVVQLSGVLINYTAPYDYWIKTGRLDWGETGIQKLSPVATHLRAIMATNPSDYDLWIVQVCRSGGGGCIWIIMPFAVVLALAVIRILRHLRHPESS
jgi:hypothetical protein